MPPSFKLAHEGNAAKQGHRAAIRTGAALAQQVINRSMEAWLKATEHEAPSEVPDSILEAAKAAQRAYEAEFKPRGLAQSKQRPGGKLAMSAQEASELLGG